ncbi:MAG: DUF2141 domain-containing protein [Bacteroidetes bacterium]|nr:MAG: DUF2141 domain-containing protein [Bacteroidota bacterium]
MKKFKSLIAGIFLTTLVFGQTGTLKIVIPNIPTEKGNIKVALYNKAGSKGFLKDLSLSYRKKEVAIINNQASVVFYNIPYGTYAVSLFQDENNNGEIDRAPIGFPVEPYGISGNKNTIGPPSFNDGKFILKTKNVSLKIILKTYLKRNF